MFPSARNVTTRSDFWIRSTVTRTVTSLVEVFCPRAGAAAPASAANVKTASNSFDMATSVVNRQSSTGQPSIYNRQSFNRQSPDGMSRTAVVLRLTHERANRGANRRSQRHEIHADDARPARNGRLGVMNWPPEDIKAHIDFMMRLQQGAERRRRAGRRRGAGRARPGAHRAGRQGRRARGHGRRRSPRPRSSSPATGSSTSRARSGRMRSRRARRRRPGRAARRSTCRSKCAR